MDDAAHVGQLQLPQQAAVCHESLHNWRMRQCFGEAVEQLRPFGTQKRRQVDRRRAVDVALRAEAQIAQARIVRSAVAAAAVAEQAMSGPQGLNVVSVELVGNMGFPMLYAAENLGR